SLEIYCGRPQTRTPENQTLAVDPLFLRVISQGLPIQEICCVNHAAVSRAPKISYKYVNVDVLIHFTRILVADLRQGDSQGLRDDVHEYLSGTTKEERVCSQWSRIAREDDLVAGFDARHECDWTSLECCGGSVSHLTRA
ncbi:hypothetical protein KXW17_006632, partial [Aspergillus fumigatus]